MNFKDYHGYKVWDNGVIMGKLTGKPLRQHSNQKGYMRTKLTINGKSKTVSVHRIIGLSFLPNIYGKPTINHKDSNRSNNSLYNLEWATIREQCISRTVKQGMSGVTGVKWEKANSRWIAIISDTVSHCKVKRFKTKEEAIAQRLAWEREYYL